MMAMGVCLTRFTKILSTVDRFNISGSEVAIYTSKYFPVFLKCLSSYKSGDLQKALEEAFIGFDATLVEEAVVRQLKDIAGVELNDDLEEDEEGLLLLIEPLNNIIVLNIGFSVKNEAALLKEEATMPIEKLMQRYKGGKANHSIGNQMKNEDSEKGSQSNGSEVKMLNYFCMNRVVNVSSDFSVR